MSRSLQSRSRNPRKVHSLPHPNPFNPLTPTRNCYCNGPPQNNISSSLCNVPCPGSPTETCGGPSLSGPPQKRQLDTNITDSYYIFNPIPLSNGTNSTGSDNSTGADGTGSGDPTQSDLGSPSTSTIYATEMITITSCAATITNCPLRNHTSAGQNPGSAVITTSTPISQVIFAPQVTTFTPCNTCEVTTTTTMLAYTTVPCPPTGTGIGGNQNSAGEATGAAKGNVSLPAGGGTPTPSSSGSGNAGVVASAGEMGVRMEVVWGLTVVGLAVLSFYC
jgi:hypothetical protein